MKKPPMRILDTVAYVTTERNRWFFISLFLSLITVVALISAYRANERAVHNLQIAWVKMQPHGTWEVDFHETAECVKDYFPATINFMLKKFVEQRYSLRPMLIENDFGEAQLLMTPTLRAAFLNPEEFDAVGLATRYQGCLDCEQTEILVRNISHYDADVTQFGPYRGTLYRTNVFVVQVHKNSQGHILAKHNKIISLQWRLKTIEEIRLNKNLLKYNPIGMEILKTDLLDEPTE